MTTTLALDSANEQHPTVDNTADSAFREPTAYAIIDTMELWVEDTLRQGRYGYTVHATLTTTVTAEKGNYIFDHNFIAG